MGGAAPRRGPRGLAAAGLASLLAAPSGAAYASCFGIEGCDGGWLVDTAVPVLIIAGLLIWVLGPFLLALIGKLRGPRAGGH